MRPNNTKHFLTGKNLFSAPFTFLYSYFLLLSLFTFSFLLFNSCNTTEPGSSPRITLNFEDASSTEVWLNLHAGVDLPADVKIYKDNKLSRTINLISKDTVIYEDNLLPQKSYTFRASAKLGDIELQSQNITAVTMDTTSHNFTWQTFTFGGANGSSILNDVAIINENNIWAVGEIHTKDTDQWNADSTEWVQPYNAVHWDGNSWELKRIYVSYRGSPNFAPLKGVFALPDGKVVFSSGLPYLPEGDHWKLYHLWDMGILNSNDGSVYSIWGTSINDIYFAGNKGTIVHYNGSMWTKIKSGTTLPFQDIWGNGGQILCLASSHNYLGRKLYRLQGNMATAISTSGLYYVLGSIWFIANRKYYVVGDGVFEKTSSKSALWYRYPLGVAASYYSKAIRGSEINDIVIAGSYGDISHFNGKSWFEYKKLVNTENRLLSVSIKGNIVIAVGYKYTGGIDDFGIIYLGRR